MDKQTIADALECYRTRAKDGVSCFNRECKYHNVFPGEAIGYCAYNSLIHDAAKLLKEEQKMEIKEQYLLKLLEEARREIICADVLREKRMSLDGAYGGYTLTDITKDKILTVLCVLMGYDLPNHGLYHLPDYSLLCGWLDDNNLENA